MRDLTGKKLNKAKFEIGDVVLWRYSKPPRKLLRKIIGIENGRYIYVYKYTYVKDFKPGSHKVKFKHLEGSFDLDKQTIFEKQMKEIINEK